MYKTIMRKCGHEETVYFKGLGEGVGEKETNETIQGAMDYECNDCYVKNNDVVEVKMDYKVYKIEYSSDYLTKPNSYDETTKQIVVYLPKNHPSL
jgi:hypothetical protein